MRLYYLLRCLKLRIWGPLIFAFTCFTLFSEVFRWRRNMDTFFMFRSSHNKLLGISLPGRRSIPLQVPAPDKLNQSHFSPGKFMKGIQPQNKSFCHFNYGTPRYFDWNDKVPTFPPELGELSPYRVIYNVIEVLDEHLHYNASAKNNLGITYCTHATPEFVHHIVELVTKWDGPISIAVFVPNTDADLILTILNHMCHCLPEMSKMSLHFVYPASYPPVLASAHPIPWENTQQTLSFLDCSMPEVILQERLQTFRQKEALTYPVNVARNVARMGSMTSHVLVSDVELLPSMKLVPEFMSMLERLRRKRVDGDSMNHYPPIPAFAVPHTTRFVFVVPVFEVEEAEEIPKTKEELLDLYAQNNAVYFHRWVCLHCQRFPGLQRWLQRRSLPLRSKHVIQPLLIVKREFPYHRWEPIFIGTNSEPLYSEQLTWEGQQDKMTQMNEMCLLGYRFVILDGAFLVHVPGIKRRSDVTTERTAWRRPYERLNIKVYESITENMAKKYGNNNRCKV